MPLVCRDCYKRIRSLGLVERDIIHYEAMPLSCFICYRPVARETSYVVKLASEASFLMDPVTYRTEKLDRLKRLEQSIKSY